MIELSKDTKTLICIGTGGVGKTTLAAALAVSIAEQGKKVLVLTIDPSQRLAQTLGIKPDGEIHSIAVDKGSLSAAVINHHKAFEFFIRSATEDNPEAANALVNNRLYQQLSGRLSGSQEFTSLITLYRYSSSGDFDLVILDTPPSQHTWNFLRAPEKIAALFNEGISQWFRDLNSPSVGLLKKALNFGTTQVLKALENLTGSQFIKELGAFFQAVQKWQAPLENYVNNSHRLLTSATTEFVLVTALDPSRLAEAQKLSREIMTQGYRLKSIVINRVPDWVTDTQQFESERINQLSQYFLDLQKLLIQSVTGFKNKLKVYKCPEMVQNESDVKTLSKTAQLITEISTVSR